MRNFIFCLITCCLVCASCNNQPEKKIHFLPLQGSMFNFMADSTFTPPDAETAAERKRAFDSCMGESYEPNAVFMKTKDTFFIGSIVNRNTMKMVKNIPFQQLQNASVFRFIERPCYDKIKLNVTPASFMKRTVELNIPGADSNTNYQFNDLFNNSKNAELEVSFWVNLELNDGFGKILDTTTNAALLEYKNILLDSSNMVLIRSTSVTKIGFYITTDKPLTTQLQQALTKTPLIDVPNSFTKISLSLINDHLFKVEFNDIFQIMGQFMQARLE